LRLSDQLRILDEEAEKISGRDFFDRVEDGFMELVSLASSTTSASSITFPSMSSNTSSKDHSKSNSLQKKCFKRNKKSKRRQIQLFFDSLQEESEQFMPGQDAPLDDEEQENAISKSQYQHNIRHLDTSDVDSKDRQHRSLASPNSPDSVAMVPERNLSDFVSDDAQKLSNGTNKELNFSEKYKETYEVGQLCFIEEGEDEDEISEHKRDADNSEDAQNTMIGHGNDCSSDGSSSTWTSYDNGDYDSILLRKRKMKRRPRKDSSSSLPVATTKGGDERSVDDDRDNEALTKTLPQHVEDIWERISLFISEFILSDLDPMYFCMDCNILGEAGAKNFDKTHQKDADGEFLENVWKERELHKKMTGQESNAKDKSVICNTGLKESTIIGREKGGESHGVWMSGSEILL